MKSATSAPARSFLSVVVAAYNVDQYLDACLASVLTQTPEGKVEIIVVIDGATDATEEVARRALSRHPAGSHKIIVQHNQGLSAARNTGVDAATSPYLTFLDGDDFWLPGYLGSVAGLLEEGNADLIEFDAMLVDEVGSDIGPLKISAAPRGATTRIDRDQFLGIFRCYAWARIYRKNLFSGFGFPKGRRFEDTLTIPFVYWRAREIASIGAALVGYRQRDGSILSRPDRTDIGDILSGVPAAAGMYSSTNDPYWTNVIFRTLQQACSRTTSLPPAEWRRMAADIGTATPPALDAGERSLARRLQSRHTFLYIVLLFLKRRFFDAVIRHLKGRGAR